MAFTRAAMSGIDLVTFAAMFDFAFDSNASEYAIPATMHQEG